MAQDQLAPLPPTPIERLLEPFGHFFKIESASGILLIAATAVALIWANSPWADGYHAIWATKITVGLGSAVLSKTASHWINDGLMAVFFFTVGLEIKREILVGELADPRKAALPLAAAVGGMLLPAALYWVVNRGLPSAGGWGIPMATDIAFALGILSMLGTRAPVSLKIFLTALAIADDLGAVLVIAIFYTSSVSGAALAGAGVLLAALLVSNRLGVRTPVIYFILGFGLWLAFLLSGIHATIGGVLAAMTIPASTRIDGGRFLRRSRALLDEFEAAYIKQTGSMLSNQKQHHIVEHLKTARRRVEPPLQRLEHAHHPWVAFAVMPIFALANAGVSFDGGILPLLFTPTALGIILGLTLGKQVGVMTLSWLVVRISPQSMPAGVSWRQLFGASCLCGIGFTMSIFIAGLALEDPALLDSAKAGIFLASGFSAVLGALILRGAKPPLEE